MLSVADNLARVREQIAEAAVKAGRQPDEVTLIGVSKTHPPEAVAAAVEAGLHDIGENRVQEAAPKITALRGKLEPAPTWHLVGHLQTNKVNASLELFDAIDSVDSLHLAEALSKRLKGRTLPILLEVYVGEDAERPGFRPRDIDEAVGRILELPGLDVRGLMTVAPLEAEARPAFAQVREIRDRLSQRFVHPRVHFGVLSMGMSEDFQVAIQEGSTQVRIGTAIFGPRRTDAT